MLRRLQAARLSTTGETCNVSSAKTYIFLLAVFHGMYTPLRRCSSVYIPAQILCAKRTDILSMGRNDIIPGQPSKAAAAGYLEEARKKMPLREGHLKGKYYRL